MQILSVFNTREVRLQPIHEVEQTQPGLPPSYWRVIEVIHENSVMHITLFSDTPENLEITPS